MTIPVSKHVCSLSLMDIKVDKGCAPAAMYLHCLSGLHRYHKQIQHCAQGGLKDDRQDSSALQQCQFSNSCATQKLYIILKIQPRAFCATLFRALKISLSLSKINKTTIMALLVALLAHRPGRSVVPPEIQSESDRACQVMSVPP